MVNTSTGGSDKLLQQFRSTVHVLIYTDVFNFLHDAIRTKSSNFFDHTHEV